MLKTQICVTRPQCVNILIVSEVMLGLLIWCVSWLPAMVEVATPAETRIFWHLLCLLSTSSDRLMQMILGGLGLGAQIMLYLWSFLLKENLLNGVKLLQMKQVKYFIPHFLTIQHWCGVDRKEGPEPTLNQKFFKETLRALGWFSFNCHTIWQHDRNATLLGVFPLSILNLHIVIAFHNGGIANFQRDPVCDNTLQDV